MPKQHPSKGKESLGYPHIEALIDSEDFNEVNEVFAKAYAELEEIAKKRRGLKKGREAKKGMKSVELTMELLRELLELKYELQKQVAVPKKS